MEARQPVETQGRWIGTARAKCKQAGTLLQRETAHGIPEPAHARRRIIKSSFKYCVLLPIGQNLIRDSSNPSKCQQYVGPCEEPCHLPLKTWSEQNGKATFHCN